MQKSRFVHHEEFGIVAEPKGNMFKNGRKLMSGISIDRQSMMMITNVIIGALGGLFVAFLTSDVRSFYDADTGMTIGLLAFSIGAMVLQTTKITRIIGALCAFAFFTGGMIVAYILIQQIYPGVIPVALTAEDAQYVVRAAIALVGVLVVCLWWKVNPYTPIESVRLTFEQ